jgi:hypothetical protein
VTLVLFHSVDLKQSKCLKQSAKNNLTKVGSDIGQSTSEILVRDQNSQRQDLPGLVWV